MYNIQILSDQDFDALPYPDTEVSLGIADPKTNTAYVRYTEHEDLNKYLVNHELEHLIEGQGGKHSDHYRNGVYYKAWLVPLIASVAGAFAAPLAQKAFGPKMPSGQAPTQFGNGARFGQGGGVGFGQQGQSSPFGYSGDGPSGGTGALGGNVTGSQVDRLRPEFNADIEQRKKGWGF